MNNEDQNNSEGFTSDEEALDFLLKEKRDQERKAEWSKKYSGVVKNKKVISLRKRILRVTAAAAVLLILAMVVFNNQTNDSDPVLMASRYMNAVELQTEGITRGSSEIENRTNIVVETMESGKYQEALSLLENLPEENNIQEKYLKLISLVKTKSSDETILKLTQEITKTDNQYVAESLWISALTKVKMNNFSSAKIDFNTLLKYKYKTAEIEQILDLM